MNLQSLQSTFAQGLQNNPINMSIVDMALLFGNSILAGLLLAASTHYITSKLSNVSRSDNDTLLGDFNILFLCVGMTGVMILVNDNFIRVFSIVAAIALIRFRVSLSERSVGASLLFGVMAGMSMGLNELMLGWFIVLVYHVLLVMMFIIKKSINKNGGTSHTDNSPKQ